VKKFNYARVNGGSNYNSLKALREKCGAAMLRKSKSVWATQLNFGEPPATRYRLPAATRVDSECNGSGTVTIR